MSDSCATNSPKTAIAYLETPIGVLRITADKKRLIAIDFCDRVEYAERASRAEAGESNAIASRALELLNAYFLGDRPDFSELPYMFPNQPFYAKVLRKLLTVKYGSTLTYAELAALAGNPKAYRAAASAVSHNPFAIAIPCHRVLHASGGVGKYMWGSDKKSWLLHHEQADSDL